MFIKLLTYTVAFAALLCLVAAGGLYRTHRDNVQMIAKRIMSPSPMTIDLRPAVYADLPEPVRRYFAFAFNGQESITLSGIDWHQTGDFMLPVVGQFYAEGQQANHPNQPIYVLTGWFWRFGLPLIESRDAFFINTHDMRAKLLGWIKVMHTDYTDVDQINSLYSYLVLR